MTLNLPPTNRPRLARVMLLLALLVAGLFPFSGDATAQPFRDSLAMRADRLDAAAADLETIVPVAATRIGAGPLLRKGRDGERVLRLSQRMAELGFLMPDRVSDRFGDDLDLAVRAFQMAEGLKVDGLVGGATRTLLDRTPHEAAMMMRQSAAAMRAFRQTAPDTVLIVNLPSQTVTLVRNGREEFTMRAVVGRPSRETPLLEDHITHVIVNPTWTVPPTILKQDKLPMLRRTGHPGVSNATVFLDGEPVIPEEIDWTVVSPGRVRIVQQPGDHNALGRFRFNMTNSLNIYLHGTNEPHLFDRDVRTVSSGCVRLQDARYFAELLLAEVNVTPARIERLLERGEPVWLKVNPLPVRFVYWTATVDDSNTVRLHHDVYDLMEEMAASTRLPPAIETAPPATPMTPMPVPLTPAPMSPMPDAPRPAAAPIGDGGQTT